MSKVIANMSMSLDGYVNHPTDGIGTLFAWMSKGPVHVDTQTEEVQFDVDAASAERLEDVKASVGALVYGRVTFEAANGWGGHHPLGTPVVIVTHRPPTRDEWYVEGHDLHFVGGVPEAIALAKKLAAGKTVAVGSGSVTSQALNLGLLDEIQVDLVPAMLGEGTRFFDGLTGTPYELGDPVVTPGVGVTHLGYPVLKRA